jgi:hypothetical protein
MAVETVDPGALEDLEEVVAATTLKEITVALVLVVVPAEATLPIFLTPMKTVPTGLMTRRRLV